MNDTQFFRYKNNKKRQTTDIYRLMRACNISRNLQSYAIEEFGEKIREYYQKLHGNLFRLFAFGVEGEFKPFWASKNEEYEEKELCILYDENEAGTNGHFVPILYPGRLLGESKIYDFGCLMPITNVFEHRWDCGFKCRNCGRLGIKHSGGCKQDGNDPIFCDQCKKTFSSRDCFDEHLRKKVTQFGLLSKSVCEKHVMCEKCGDKYLIKAQTKNGAKHICGQRYCPRCGGYHGPRLCFIRPFKSEEGAERRIILSDLEATTDLQPEPDKARFKHQANFIRAMVICTICKRNGTWNQPLEKECEICGQYRHFSWSIMDYKDTEVDVKYITPTPVKDFVEWKLKYFKKKKQNPEKSEKTNIEKKRRNNLEKKRRKRILGRAMATNPFLDLEAEDDDVSEEEMGEGEEDDESNFDDFINDESESDEEMEEHATNESHTNMLSGFLERTEAEPMQMDVPGPSNSNRLSKADRQLLESVWRKTDEETARKLHEQGLLTPEEQKVKNEEERKKKLIDEEEAKKKKEERRKKREVYTYVYTHYGQKYDNVFAIYELFGLGYCPKVIMQGKRYYQIQVRRRGVITPTYYRDSYHLIPLKLEAFVPTFKLNIPGIEGKQFFPYKYNKMENLGKVLPHLPPMEDYCVGSMLKKKRDVFYPWYQENYPTEFDLGEVVADYCSSDVKILAYGFVENSKIFEKATGMDITKSITYSSAAMKFFRTFVEKDQLALTPEMGYEKRENSSSKARKYIKYLESKHKIKIQSADSIVGEKAVGKWKLDGYIERDESEGGPIGIEINGCFWHACRRYYPTLKEEDFLGRKNVREIWKNDREKANEVRKSMHLWVIWECEIDHEMEENPELQAFMDNCPDTGPINLRDAFMGGRTGPEWLIANAPEDQSKEAVRKANIEAWESKADRKIHTTIKVKDFNSLYPSVNFESEYPIGHPRVEIHDKAVNWTKPSDIPYYDQIIKCFVVPPRHLDIPALPNRFGKDPRLLFSLCRTCALNHKEGHYDPNYLCPHLGDEARGHVGVYAKPELELALEAGYRVIKHYRSYVWDENIRKQYSTELFKPYIRAIMRLKYMASGWPASITDPSLSEDERDLAKIQYVIEAAQQYGIQFSVEDVEANPGLKFIAKLLLNSLWGRFALRNRLSCTVYVSGDVQIAKYLNNKKIKIERCEQITKKIWMIVYKTKEEYVRENDCSNIILALWTTSLARVKLLKVMQKHLKRPDVRILYYDTDSIFYQYDTELGDPLEDGKHLGELTDQYPNHVITEYICLVPKFYSLKMVAKSTGQIEYETKSKGFTLDCDNAEKLNHDTMKAQLLTFLKGEMAAPIACHYPNSNFRTTKEGEIYTVPLTKLARPIINKGIVRDDGRVLPFGYSEFNDPINDYYYKVHDEPNNFYRLKYSRYEKEKQFIL